MMTRRFVRLGLGAAWCAMVGALSGCLERFESITIKPDGSAVLRSEFRGTPDDFRKEFDPLPEQGGGWQGEQREEKDADGKPRVVRVAEKSVAAGGEIPGTYAGAGDPRASVGLKFPTTLKVATVGPNTYFDFSRTYQRRDEAKYAYLTKQLKETPALKALEGKDPSALTAEERHAVVRAFARIEADKHVRYIETGAAALETDGTWGQEIGLVLRAAAVDYGDRFDTAKAEALLAGESSPERESAIKAMSEAFIDGLRQAVGDALESLAVPEPERKRFVEAALRERAMRHATEDLADERWEVRVTMPGTLSAHNADRVEKGVLIWEFKADAIMDRDQVIRATSFVPSEPRGASPR